MNEHEEDLQKRIEVNASSDLRSVDERAYRTVFRALNREPKVNVRRNIAEAVVAKLILRKKREARRDFIWLTFGVVFLSIGLIVTVVLAGLQLQLGFLKDISAYAGVFVFGVILILAFNFFEKRTLLKT